jgi:CheY-like chemotaxis protein
MSLATPILLVEDDEVDVEIVRRMLKKADVKNPLYLARDGVEALEMLGNESAKRRFPQQPCLILLDINMPRMNGFEFLAELKKRDVIKRNVVFMLTTSPRSKDKDMSYDLHAAGYMLKNDMAEIGALLHSYMAVNRFPDDEALLEPASSVETKISTG